MPPAGYVSKTPISRAGFAYGNGWINAESTKPKIATAAAIPSESVNTVVIANPGDLRNCLKANRMSVKMLSSPGHCQVHGWLTNHPHVAGHTTCRSFCCFSRHAVISPVYDLPLAVKALRSLVYINTNPLHFPKSYGRLCSWPLTDSGCILIPAGLYRAPSSHASLPRASAKLDNLVLTFGPTKRPGFVENLGYGVSR